MAPVLGARRSSKHALPNGYRPRSRSRRPEAEAAYRERTQMFKDVVQLKKPVRVPIMLTSGIVPFVYAGITTEEAMYDYDKLGLAFKKYNQDFQTDTVISCLMAGSGPLFDILDYKLYRWPGRGVAATAPTRRWKASSCMRTSTIC